MCCSSLMIRGVLDVLGRCQELVLLGRCWLLCTYRSFFRYSSQWIFDTPKLLAFRHHDPDTGQVGLPPAVGVRILLVWLVWYGSHPPHRSGYMGATHPIASLAWFKVRVVLHRQCTWGVELFRRPCPSPLPSPAWLPPFPLHASHLSKLSCMEANDKHHSG